jgi:hypothetical protein
MKAHFCFILLAVLLLGQAPTNAQSTDDNEIRFTVPIRLLSLHQNIRSVKVVCTIFDGNDMEVGSGENVVDVPANGDLVQTLRFSAHSLPGRDIMAGVRFTCSLLLGSNTMNGFVAPVQESPEDGYNPLEIKAKRGEPFRVSYSAPLLSEH